MEITLHCLEKKITEFNGFSPRLRGRRKEVIESRRLFYKYALEHNITSKKTGEHIGLRGEDSASLGRRIFTASFSTNPYNLNLWRRFIEFMRRESLEVASSS